ncbi:Sin3 family co-repressor-domain-containing protein [Syncephalastrum racemosum]|uniref:Sin3 family co-repressor-domain-containing protein n=1 Tax=Syncephalastrum racemosum TaxID=13706 RepID=A0A1X2HIM7_SYNRA|nr:Sin3 family co-repressor-domain-containing protein [Syncephalastrum racemosum]
MSSMTASSSDAMTQNDVQSAPPAHHALHPHDAMTYLEAVKSQFANHPDQYSAFVNLIKESKHEKLDVNDVLNSVTELFRDYPHLLEGFNAFLPAEYRYNETTLASRLKETAITDVDAALSFIHKLKSRFANKPHVHQDFVELLVSLQKELTPNEVHEKARFIVAGDAELLEELETFLPRSPSTLLGRRSMDETNDGEHDVKRQRIYDFNDSQPDVVTSVSSYVRQSSPAAVDIMSKPAPSDLPERMFPSDESAFFRNVRSLLRNTATNDAFLKLLNLYHQNIIDRDTLIIRSASFLQSDPYLYDHLKELVGYTSSEKPAVDAYITTEEPAYGPSYRTVAKSIDAPRCSGQDKHCASVLNNDYASHPTWASEAGGFVSSKKNQFEESMHRTEEERYLFDLLIESGLTAIGMLDRMSKDINALHPPRQADYQPPATWTSLYVVLRRVFTKIYDARRANEMIDMLHTNPSQAIPSMMKRLSAKIDDWKKEKRDRNEIWRRKEGENYYKALDYRAYAFKNHDKKLLSPKTLTEEIEALRRDQLAQEELALGPQLEFHFADPNVFIDMMILLSIFSEHQTVQSAELTQQMQTTFKEMLRMVEWTPSSSGRVRCLFANDHIYVFWRVFRLLYERLDTIKRAAIAYEEDPEMAQWENRSALDTTLETARVHGLDLDFRQGYYKIMLSLTERMFKHEVEHGKYEDCLRHIFGLQAYVLFTIDKLMFAFSHAVFMLTTDPASKRLIRLCQGQGEVTHDVMHREMQPYRHAAEEILADDDKTHLYRLLFTMPDRHERKLSIELLGSDDVRAIIQRHRDYLHAYLEDWDQDRKRDGRSLPNVGPVFLQRNHQPARNIYSRPGHRYKICRKTYRLFTVVGTEDALIRPRSDRRCRPHVTGQFSAWVEQQHQQSQGRPF